MATTALWDYQKAVKAVLDADGTLTGGLANGADSILDHIPSGESMPYVVIGQNDTEAAWDTFGRDGKEMLFTIQVFSEYQGFSEALQVAEDLVAALDGASISPSVHTHIYIHHESTEKFRDEDDLSRVVMRFRSWGHE